MRGNRVIFAVIILVVTALLVLRLVIRNTPQKYTEIETKYHDRGTAYHVEEQTEITKNASIPHARFVYLIQGPNKHEIPELSATMDREIIWLTFQEKDGDIYYPMSTWTQGRNVLLREAVFRATKREGSGYLYYIFMDDDLQLRVVQDEKRWWKKHISKNPFERFEQFLIDYEPAVSYGPLNQNYVDVHAPVNVNFNFDAQFNAFHRHTLSSLLPFIEDLDGKSWYFSQWLVILLSAMLYNSHRVQCNSIEQLNVRSHYGKNRGNAPVYTDSLEFNIPQTYMKQALIDDAHKNKSLTQGAKSLFQIFGKKVHYWRGEGTAKKKGQTEYRVSTKFIFENFNQSHPLTKTLLHWRQTPGVKYILYGRTFINPSDEPEFIPDIGKPLDSPNDAGIPEINERT